jgi:hypothetical protein
MKDQELKQHVQLEEANRMDNLEKKWETGSSDYRYSSKVLPALKLALEEVSVQIHPPIALLP